ncbi:MAG TPA: hypothetical protein VJ302_16720 [Blastocatellia bacterium]|nr:hypothetical protein [Blastocatellia bacterium]
MSIITGNAPIQTSTTNIEKTLSVRRASISVKEFAEAHRLSLDSVYSAIASGRFPFKFWKIGRSIRISVDALGDGSHNKAA